MRLDDARLCMDCEEVHDEQDCPACGSEAFAFLTRWIKPADGQRRGYRRDIRDGPGRPEVTSDQLDAWRRIVDDHPEPRRRGGLVAKGLVGLAAMGLAGWAWTKAGREGKGKEGS